MAAPLIAKTAESAVGLSHEGVVERLTIALPLEALEGFGLGWFIHDVEPRSSHILRLDGEAVTYLARVRPRLPGLLPEEWLSRSPVRSGRFLRREGEEWLVLLSVKTPRRTREVLDRFPDIYPCHFTQVIGRRIHVCLLGERGRLQEYLQWSREQGVPVEVVRFEEVSDRTHDYLEGLTPRQKEILKAAHALGYFETPRRVKLRDLARMFGRDPSSVMALLRRAQKRVLDEAFG